MVPPNRDFTSFDPRLVESLFVGTEIVTLHDSVPVQSLVPGDRVLCDTGDFVCIKQVLQTYCRNDASFQPIKIGSHMVIGETELWVSPADLKGLEKDRYQRSSSHAVKRRLEEEWLQYFAIVVENSAAFLIDGVRTKIRSADPLLVTQPIPLPRRNN